MKYSLKQIEVFDAIASQESVSAAARKLMMTQSAVSMSLSQLENQLGRPLFSRQGNRLVLSHWGHWLRPKARSLLNDARQIESGLHDQQVISGDLSICASQTAAEHLIPELISKIDSDFPQLHIRIDVENTETVIQRLLNYDFDLGVIEGRSDDTRITSVPWIDDHLVVVGAPEHAFAHQAQVSLEQLAVAKWVLREHGAGTRRIFDGAVHGKIDKLNVCREYEQVSILKALVKGGSYLSALPWLDVMQDIQRGQLALLPTPSLDMHRSLSFVWRSDSTNNPLRDCVLAQAKRLAKQKAQSTP
ncbi:MAG: LysR substrate-binding domain-containing protein [Shewanella sp.]|uniref:LysR substrate-binding domain-containing protein n=1 Tax=Shewanella sp. SNU WT4 TaxID=2590015 RepID=UPI001129E2DF|nr:LysR substrate-binding domain-containing protein [Shewanella sp. SNU WT4]QDF68564.1 LysR family transcriptional regulator [Shewanella sp. SNU WT4]